MGRMGICVFCGRKRRLTKEDAWPTWLMEIAYPPGKQADMAWGRTEAELQASRRPAANRLKVEALCADCNGNWLGPIEKRTKPHLRAWMIGIHNAMTILDQRRLSFWAVKTAMTVQIAHARAKRVIPMTEYHRLYAAKTHPPSGVHVWMALTRTWFPGVGFGSAVQPYLYPVEGTGRAKPYTAYRVRLFVYHVAFEVLGHDGPAEVPPAQILPHDFAKLDSTMIQIWPAISRYTIAPPTLS